MTQALLVIDVQVGLFHASPRPHLADEVIEKINTLANRARLANVPVIFIQHEDATDLVVNTGAWALAPNLQVYPVDLKVRKQTPDAFLGTTLAALLTAHAVTQVVVAGYASEFCIDTTVRRAAALGLNVVLAADAHTTHDKTHASGAQIRAHHNATLAAISSFGVPIKATPGCDVRFGD